MKKTAILSDINGNLEAMNAVLDDVECQRADSVVFLGDAIGYGADSLACLDAMRQRADTYVMGRIEAKVSAQPIEWQTLTTELPDASEILASNLLPWLRARPQSVQLNGLVAIHGNPRGPEHKCLSITELQVRPESCLLYTSPSPRDQRGSRMPSSA